MRTEEFLKLSRAAVSELIHERLSSGRLEPFAGQDRRRLPRWPFPGQVEIRPADDPHAPPTFFDCRNLSETGLGMSGSEGFEIGTRVELSLHLPEATLYGEGVVRYCMRVQSRYMVGLEFLFDE
ncbi:MAG: PilZ domain-containing protein [Phycisphaerae bacterium]|jgi:hypothetical protein